MFYIMYLTSLCTRRSWPQPQFEPFQTRRGHGCIVRVNNREYSTGDTSYGTEELARDAAATQAYMICRNFSVNDGMLPGAHPGMAAAPDAVCQGLPVAIGAGRHRVKTVPKERTTSNGSEGSSASGNLGLGISGALSVSSLSSETDLPLRQGEAGVQFLSGAFPHPRRYYDRRAPTAGICICRRAQAMGVGRCGFCLREAGLA